MLQSATEAEAYLESGPSLLGPGWREVDNFEDLSDEDEYTTDEEEIYAVLDFGSSMDRQALQTESTYQLIGIDTPVPFIKLGNQVYQGEMTSLIGDEVILGMVRNPSNPTKPSHPPLHTSSHHLLFRPITLYPRGEMPAVPGKAKAPGTAPIPTDPAGLKRGVGRPKNTHKRMRILLKDEMEILDLDLEGLPDDVVIELEPGPQAVKQGEAAPSRIKMTKVQAQRIILGLPDNVRRTRDPVTGTKSFTSRTSQAGRRAKERLEAAAGGDPEEEEMNGSQDEGNARAGPSTEDPNYFGPPKRRKKKARVKKGEEVDPDHPETLDGEGGEEEEDDEEEDDVPKPPDIAFGGLYLTSHDPAREEKAKAKKKSVKKAAADAKQPKPAKGPKEPSEPKESKGKGKSKETPGVTGKASGSKKQTVVEAARAEVGTEDVDMGDGGGAGYGDEAPGSPLNGL